MLHSPVLLRYLSYFSDICKANGDYNGFPSLIKEVIPIPDKNTLSVFHLSPITPAVISGAIKKRSSGSSLGEDQIAYHHLKIPPSAHHNLAT